MCQTLITAMFAYGFSRPYLRGKRLYSVIGFISMYLNGGVIAYFILYNALKIYNTYWVYILPALFGGFYNVIIFNANYKAIPDALFESAKIDGASEYRIFFQIVMPLSKPVLSALGIFTAVGTWNDYAATLYYTRSSSLQTLSYYLLSITKSSKAAEELQKAMIEKNDNTRVERQQARVSKKSNVHEVIEVDLHAHELLETTSGMSAADIKEYQLGVFRKTLDAHIKHKGQRIVFIHGKGEGVLRNAMIQELKHKYKNCSFQDASFQQYGFGATMVIVH